MKKQSNNVWSDQDGINKNLLKTLTRYDQDEYMRPIADFSLRAFIEIMDKVESFGSKEIVLDICCGTGESSFYHAKTYPNNLVIGVDKSISRLTRNNEFKKDIPDNLLLIRADVLDLYYLFYKAVLNGQIKVVKQFILYPNPWPKAKHYKRRFSANPITPFIFKLGCDIELRSNWKTYLDEFCYAAEYFQYKRCSVEIYKPEVLISAFERKFFNSEHNLYVAVCRC